MPYLKGVQAPMEKLQAQPLETPTGKKEVDIGQITTEKS